MTDDDDADAGSDGRAPAAGDGADALRADGGRCARTAATPPRLARTT